MIVDDWIKILLVAALVVGALLLGVVASADIVADQVCVGIGYDKGVYDSYDDGSGGSGVICSYDALTITLPEIKDWYDEHTEVNDEQ